MQTIDRFPDLGFIRLGPDVDDATAELRAWQISHFMREEVHGPVYETEFGLPYISRDPDTGELDPKSGTPGDIPWRIDSMRQNHIVRADGSYREYLVAMQLDKRGRVSNDRLAVAGLVVATKPDGLCAAESHKPTYIQEIDVARAWRGKGLAAHLLNLLDTTHPDDPRISAEIYEGNLRSQEFFGKLGFVIDTSVKRTNGEVYKGRWLTVATTGQTFTSRLAALIRP